MKTVFEILHSPVVIGAFILAVLIVVGSYIGSEWYYGDVKPVEVVEVSIPIRSLPQNVTPSEVDLSGLQGESESTVPPAESESVDDFLAQLSDEEKTLLTTEVVEALPSRESPHGLGPYPDIPSDYPRQNIWDDLEKLNDVASNELGRSSIDHELMHRVLIKLWNQGKKAEGGILDGDNGRVYPMYNDTVYVHWSESENEDGSFETYLGRYRCHPSLKDYRDSVENGTQPSWIKVIPIEEGGVAPYSFLDSP